MIHCIAVHGNGGGGARFERVHQHLPEDVSLHALTLPGFGSRPADPNVDSMAAYANALANELEDVPRPRVLLGHGIGGSFVLELLREHEAQVDAVILHAPVGARLDRRWFPRLMRLPGMRPLLLRAIGSPILRGLWSRKFFRGSIPREARDAFFDDYRRCSVFARMFDLITAEWFESLESRDTPAVLLWGERERVLTVEQIDAFERLLPAARRHLVESWDHFPMVDSPEDYARELASLLRSLAGEASRT